MSIIEITNHGPLITATNYWQSEYAEAGRVIVSPNGGAIRCLLPPDKFSVVGPLRRAKYAIVTVGRWSRFSAQRFGCAMPIADGAEAIEILWEDHTDSPHTWHLSSDSCLLVPGDPSPNQWVITLWVERRGEPHKALERPAKWRRAAHLPFMRPMAK